jgi:hypothetical protein
MLGFLRKLVAKVYMQYEHIIPKLSKQKQKIFNQIMDMDITYSIEDSLQCLSEYLCKVYGQKCVVLVDEYDAPLMSAYSNGYYEKANGFFAKWFSSLLKVSVVFLELLYKGTLFNNLG